MKIKNEVRAFFISCSNGDVFYFNINNKGEIFCREFVHLFGNILPVANCIEFSNNEFILIDINGNRICSLNDYKNILNSLNKNSVSMNEEFNFIERLYIDDDVKINLLKNGKLKYDEEGSKIPGLFNDGTYSRKLVNRDSI